MSRERTTRGCESCRPEDVEQRPNKTLVASLLRVTPTTSEKGGLLAHDPSLVSSRVECHKDVLLILLGYTLPPLPLCFLGERAPGADTTPPTVDPGHQTPTRRRDGRCREHQVSGTRDGRTCPSLSLGFPSAQKGSRRACADKVRASRDTPGENSRHYSYLCPREDPHGPPPDHGICRGRVFSRHSTYHIPRS